LAGFPPFYAETDEQLLELISEGKFSFPSKYWREISSGAKDLIRKLLEKNTSLRYTARQVLEHPWIVVSIFQEKSK
jgi:calcium/calmodulin-dependent protein kinase I